MNMKKTLALCLTIAICATMALGGTLAYLTDTEEAVNIMTVGRVDIELIEQQRDENGELEDFEQGKQLLPIVGSAQGEKDKWGMPTAENYVDKVVTVENTGNTPAWVRVITAVPVALEDEVSASKNALHWNNGDRFDINGTGAYNNAKIADYNAKVNLRYVDDAGNRLVTTVDGVDYYIYIFTYQDQLPAKTTTEYATMMGFYLDEKVDWDDETGKYTLNGVVIDYDFAQGVKIPVVAQAVQADGFDTAEEAFTASGLPTNPWENVTTDITTATTEADLVKGGTVVLDERIDLTSTETIINNPTTLSLGEHAVISSRNDTSGAEKYSTLTIYADTTIEGDGTIENNDGYAISVKEGATLTIKGGNYTGVVTAINVVKGTVIIEGGYFEVGDSEYGSTFLVNCIDANYKDGSAQVVITGGTFKGWNPDANASEGAGTDFVPDGYVVIEDTEAGTYTVVPESAI